MNAEQILKEKYGLEIPAPPKPGGIYSPACRTGNLLYLSGQTCTENGVPKFTGTVGDTLTIEEGQKAAQLCALNLLSVLKAALDQDLSRVRRIVQLIGFVRCQPDFCDQPQVINGASQLFKDLFGEDGMPSRMALGTNALPGGAAVEILLVVEITD
ncbi:RidA family protein [Ruthenibacterium sp. CLA-JM-H11]|uniref:RidA family protein n=1 Tax=Ruthenibacterium intestinale TaxID=3133163 RepID=A0ABV1GE19_9FIRM